MKNLYDMFTKVALPFSKGDDLSIKTKEGMILHILDGLNGAYIERIGIIIPSLTKDPKKVIVSHIDLVHPFQSGFQIGKTFKVFEEEGVLMGALDNTLTNAFVLLAILELRNKGLAQDVEFLFTEGEESGMYGMSNYMNSKHYNIEANPFFINLDVTNDNPAHNGSIEFDYPCLSICQEINDNCDDLGFTEQRFADDTSVIIGKTQKAFSYCIPTWNYCHTYESYTKVEKLQPYYDGLIYLIDKLNVSNYQNDINSINRRILD